MECASHIREARVIQGRNSCGKEEYQRRELWSMSTHSFLMFIIMLLPPYLFCSQFPPPRPFLHVLGPITRRNAGWPEGHEPLFFEHFVALISIFLRHLTSRQRNKNEFENCTTTGWDKGIYNLDGYDSAQSARGPSSYDLSPIPG